jgi:hypothetical protein
MRNPYFPFHSMGFRCNPFRSLTDGEWTQIVVLHPTLEAISTAGFTHLQVLGDPGYGKTSTLLGLRAHYTKLGKRAAYEYLPPGKRVFTTDIRDLEVFLLDEFQRLSTRHRRQLIKEVATWPDDGLQLVFSSHVDFAAHFAKHGVMT